MWKWSLQAAVVLLTAAACAPESETVSDTPSTSEAATATTDAAPSVGARELEPASAELSALVPAAAEGLPEVRYYSLGGT